MQTYTLTKLSSGWDVEVTTDNINVIIAVLECGCCKTCVGEAKRISKDKEHIMYHLADSSCGAEFMLEVNEKE